MSEAEARVRKETMYISTDLLEEIEDFLDAHADEYYVPARRAVHLVSQLREEMARVRD